LSEAEITQTFLDSFGTKLRDDLEHTFVSVI